MGLGKNREGGVRLRFFYWRGYFVGLRYRNIDGGWGREGVSFKILDFWVGIFIGFEVFDFMIVVIENW